jgi:radical SAM superfamily enzyme YgiQ (UPF0313 family)
MKIVFVDGILLDSYGKLSPRDVQPQLGLISMIPILEAAGHNVELYSPMLDVVRGTLSLDSATYHTMADEILRRSPDVVGFTTLGCNFIVTVQVAAMLKQCCPLLPIILGGPHATVLHRVIMQTFKQFDFIVLHEAEEKIVPLITSISTGIRWNVPGVTWREGDTVITNPGPQSFDDLDALPFPAYDHFPIKEVRPSFLRVEAGRGCPFSCTFCSTATFFGRKFRLKSASKICGELQRLRKLYGVTRFSLQHDLFTVNRKKVVEFCEEVRDLDVTWTCSARIDCVDDELLHQMGAAGCRAIFYGVESGSVRMQSVMRKRLDLDLLLPRLQSTLAAGIVPTASFIIGYPQETEDDLNATLDCIGQCLSLFRDQIVLQLHLLTPEPGTGLLTEFGNNLEYDGHISDFNFPHLTDDDARIMQQHPDIFMTHFYYRGELPRQRLVASSSSFYALLQYGAHFVAHIVEISGSTLSVLIQDIYAWAQVHADSSAITSSDMVTYFGERFGKDSYIVSCALHLNTSINLPKQTKLGTVNTEDLRSERRMFSWSPYASILPDVHDYSAILNRIANKAPISDASLSRRSFLMVKDSSNPMIVRNYALNEGTLWFVDVIRKARSDEEIFEWAELAGVDADQVNEFRLQLTGIGCLV